MLDKVKLFVTIFASNSTSNGKGRLFPDLPRLTEHNLGKKNFITTQEVKSIKSLDLKYVTGPDKIPVFPLLEY